MKIYYAPYELCPNQAQIGGSKRQGFLIKVIFEPSVVGYADCHPWPELGDLPVQQQLEKLALGDFTPITRCAIEFASLDAKSRAQDQQILAFKKIPQSHFLVLDIGGLTPARVEEIIKQGFTHIKLKMGRQLKHETASLLSLFLHSPLKLRLDFNEKLSFREFTHFLQSVQQLQKNIDFIEDPCPFVPGEWKAIQKEGWTLACDRKSCMAANHPQAARILIVKPAIQCMDKLKDLKASLKNQMCIVTSYLGHPLGQVAAAYIAAEFDPTCRFVHGLLSHHVYCPTPFSQHLNSQGPFFKIPDGKGCGFDHELDQLEWRKIACNCLGKL